MRKMTKTSMFAIVVVAALAALFPRGGAEAAIVATAAERRCGNTTDKVQLTFDDTADRARVSAILDVLAAKQVRAGFFITGQWARSNPDVMARIRNEGHWLGNHSATHANLTRLSNAGIAGEIDGGVRSQLFRPPYGAADGRVRELAASASYRLCFWDIDTLDWRRRSAVQIQQTVYDQLRPGAVVLAHLHGRYTLEALPDLIDGIRSRGFALDGLSRFSSATVDQFGNALLLERDGRVLGGPRGDEMVVAPVVGPADAVALTGRRKGLAGNWIAGASGGVYAVGGAPFLGAETGLNAPVVSIASTPSGEGYWTAASDGGIFAHGDAGFFGSTGDLRLNQPIVAMSATPTGRGYWLLAADGGMFAFGDAAFFGSSASSVDDSSFVAMAARPQGDGYWLARRDGTVLAFGGAADRSDYARSTSDGAERRSFLAIATDQHGHGYRLVADRPGEVYDFR